MALFERKTGGGKKKITPYRCRPFVYCLLCCLALPIGPKQKSSCGIARCFPLFFHFSNDLWAGAVGFYFVVWQTGKSFNSPPSMDPTALALSVVLALTAISRQVLQAPLVVLREQWLLSMCREDIKVLKVYKKEKMLAH